MANGKQSDQKAELSPLERFRHDLGTDFINALDDIRQRVVEEAWSGKIQTTGHRLESRFDDPLAALFGKASDAPGATPAPSAAAEQRASCSDAEWEAVLSDRVLIGEMLPALADDAKGWDALWGRSGPPMIAGPEADGPEPDEGSRGIDR